MMGVMQSELQEKRQWVSKARFLEGVSLANVLPGPTMTQLSIFLGYARGGWWGGLLAGLCFVVPGFLIILTLTLAYAALGASPILRGAVHGLGPVVLGIYLAAVVRLGRTAVRGVTHAAIATAAGAAISLTPLGVASIILLAAGTGLLLFYSRRIGGAVLIALVAVLGLLHLLTASTGSTTSAPPPEAAGLAYLAAMLFKIGAFTFGGGLTMIAFIEEQVVQHLHWLTPQEFLDGLALGQLTPGPILVIAAYVGFKAMGVVGAVVGTSAAFLPSFVMMLTILPVFERGRNMPWTKAAMAGIGPAVVGLLAVSLARLAPHAVPDAFALAMLIATLAAVTLWRVGPFMVMLAGGALGVLRKAYVWR
jgi:chromate transporter